MLDEISSKAHLNRAWQVIKKRDVAAGVDGITVDIFESSLSIQISVISRQLLAKKYSFQASKRKAIPKGSGQDTRDIHIFSVRDKVVQQAIQSKLLAKKKETSLFPEVYNDVAVAYIPKLNGVAMAVKKIKGFHSQGKIFITCLDIKDFFDNIPGDELFKIIIKRLPDDSINWLIEATIKQKIFALEEDVDKVLQGAVLAPLYSNIFLSKFDKYLIENGILAIRYADDLAIFSSNEQEATKSKAFVRKALKEIAKMDFYPDGDNSKAPKTRCLNDFAEFLGFRFTKGPRNLVISPSSKKINEEKQKITDVFSSLEFPTFVRKIQRCNRSISSWCQHYFRCGANQAPMRDAVQEISKQYENLAIHFLRKINVISANKLLSRIQLNEIGLLSPTNIKRKRSPRK